MNFVVGQNNTGKSNVLRLLARHLDPLLTAAKNPGGGVNLGFDQFDVHEPSRPPLRFSLGWPPDEVAGQVSDRFPCGTNLRDALSSAIEAMRHPSDGLAWFEYQRDRDQNGERLVVAPDAMNQLITDAPHAWEMLEERLTNQRSGRRNGSVISALRQLIAPLIKPARVAFVPAVRKIGATSIGEDLSGADLVTRLDELQHPSIAEQEKRTFFESITTFVRLVLDEPTAAIEVPSQRNTIHVRLRDVWRTLESIGTGVHETVMLAVFATVHRDQIVCIEEPELHLHPLLQQKLIRFLAEQTTNQYFISTHSAHLLNLPGASVFHVRLEEDRSVVDYAATDAQRVRICADLGYRAADIIQSNAVVWVEGPSDRLYIGHWLRYIAPELVEGIHFSIMFYGGRLLAHLSAGDDEVTEFISLRQINQYLAIVIDSDRPSRGARINLTKQRVRREFDSGPGFAWVTQGREIENYVPATLIASGIAAIHPGGISLADDSDPYIDNLQYRPRRGQRSQADKVKLARYVVGHDAQLTRLDVRMQVSRLARFIRAANDLPVG